MKKHLVLSLVIGLFLSTLINAQSSIDSDDSRKTQVVVTENIPTPAPTARRPTVVTTNSLRNQNVTPNPTTQTNQASAGLQIRGLSYREIANGIEEAKRKMRTKPLHISQYDSRQTTEVVRIAFIHPQTKKIDYAVMRKEAFLDKNYNVITRSEGGQPLRIQTIRGNGVNTPLIIYDRFNRPLVPLIVQYPIERYGSFREMAYYVSTHPGIVTPEVVNVGRMYVKNVLNFAAQRLRSKGIFIQPKVIEMAEKLALVEHVDHYRFRNEYHPKIYNDVYTLYALNRGQTYRYSVSSAGAGGMVQMIPSTYRMIRSRYYKVGLNPSFVNGMRDHQNAAQAMLLYMQMTWSDLVANSTVFDALTNGIATPEQLMAAGYNSNPARLPRYIRRGGKNWTSLIPSETKVYLRILSSVERHVPFGSRK